MKKSATYFVIWAVYLCLLAALLPHTQWAFRQLEPAQSPAIVPGYSLTWADLTAAVLAFAFEAGIAVFTHRLARKIEAVKPKTKQQKQDGAIKYVPDRWATFTARYNNSFTFALLVCAGVSGIANYSHAVQFSGALVVFSKLPFMAGLYPFAFGAALPVVSLIFASALSNVTEDESAEDPQVTELKDRNAELTKANRELTGQFKAANSDLQKARQELTEAESRLAAIESEAAERVRALTADLTAARDRLTELESLLATTPREANSLFTGDVREKILTARQLWPDMPTTGLASIAGVSHARVSQILKDEPIPVSIDAPLSVAAD